MQLYLTNTATKTRDVISMERYWGNLAYEVLQHYQNILSYNI